MKTNTRNHSQSQRLPDRTAVRPYGDSMDDGAVQLSFTLPMTDGVKARAAAKALCEKMGLQEINIAHSAPIAPGFTLFIVYAQTDLSIDPEMLPTGGLELPDWSREEIESRIEQFGRPLVVVGACTGSDAHTVGLDAILNMKGCYGEYGLERYNGFTVHNLGAQVPNATLIQKALDVQADAILVSQMVTQKEIHRINLHDLITRVKKAAFTHRPLQIVGGARIRYEQALEWGFDAGFGPGTRPRQVAAFLVERLVKT
jgi:beta-lysine 5,6-aminomutase beta subunit